ncbi:hypothetical protein SAMN05428981_1048 [Bacillus sp. OV194]|nr:hypothetical protein SAMN05428981_1048 [Bacillus sp. OV194]
MKNKGMLLTFSLNYSFDSLLLYLIVISLLPFSLILFLKFFALYILGCLPFVLLFTFSKKMSVGKIILLSPIAFGIAYLFGFGAAFSFLLAGIIAWRAWANWSEPIKQDMEVIWLVSFVLAFFQYIFFPNIPEALLLIPTVQLAYLILLKSYHRNLNDGKPCFQNTKQGILSLSVLLSSAVAAYLAFPFFSFLFKNLMGLLLYAVFTILSKPLFFLYSLLPISDGGKRRAEAFAGSFKGSKKVKGLPHVSPFHNQWILWIICAVILLALLIYFRRRIISTLGQTISSQSIQPIMPGEKPALKRRRFWKTPADEARKVYIQFEKRMTKLGGGRAYDESVTEWLHRLDLPKTAIEIVSTSYNKVRYGGLSLDSDELDFFKKETRSLTGEFKKRNREERT